MVVGVWRDVGGVRVFCWGCGVLVYLDFIVGRLVGVLVGGGFRWWRVGVGGGGGGWVGGGGGGGKKMISPD